MFYSNYRTAIQNIGESTVRLELTKILNCGNSEIFVSSWIYHLFPTRWNIEGKEFYLICHEVYLAFSENRYWFSYIDNFYSHIFFAVTVFFTKSFILHRKENWNIISKRFPGNGKQYIVTNVLFSIPLLLLRF